MRQPINPVAGMTNRMSSFAVSFSCDVYQQQPGTGGQSGKFTTLPVVSGRLSDDASRQIQRTMTIGLSSVPGGVVPGMWIEATIGIATVQPLLYRLPVMRIAAVTSSLDNLGGASIEVHDPSGVIEDAPYTADTTLTGTLRSVVQDACAILTRTTDVTQVPDIAVPDNFTAEFGQGRWSTCVRLADALGVVLRFTDPGDVIGTLRSATPPGAIATVERALLPGGKNSLELTPTAAYVLVTRSGEAPLTGIATVTPTFPFYQPVTVTDRHEGDATTTQAQADQFALDLYNARTAELDTFDRLAILPSPFLEAGADVVTFNGKLYSVRAVELEMPSLQTVITIRRVVT